MTDARIYIACHATNPGLNEAPFVPIHVGRARAGAAIPGTIGDDDGDNISTENPRYCELTALYWAWRNGGDEDYVGLMHYRRFLDFEGAHDDKQAEQFVSELDLRAYERGATDWIAANLGDYDLIVPKVHTLGRTLRANYASAHEAEDLDICRAAMAETTPEMLPVFDAVCDGKALRLANMFAMRRNLFDEYCAWMFPILEKVDAAPHRPMNPYQNRRLGFLSERLFTAWIEHQKASRPDIRMREVHILNTARALVTPMTDTSALNGPEHVNIAFSADRAFLPHTAAMLASVKRHCAADRVYNLFFLHSGIAPTEIEVLQGMLADAPNMRLTPIAVGDRFADAYRSKVRAPSNATYNRFLLFTLLEGLDRLLYLDVDMVALGDVAEIFDYDLGDAQVGAVTDYIMTRGLVVKARLKAKDIEDLRQYQADQLKMNDEEVARYFNAGLLLFNFAAMDVRKVGRELTEMAMTGQYFFRDQDILNSYFRKSLCKLPARFNVFNSLANRYANVPVDNHAEAMAAKRDPLIVHYASAEFKPWRNPDVHFGQHYWEALRQTPFYQDVLMAYVTGQFEARLSTRAKLGRFADERLTALKRLVGLK
ncbi:MAG: DUF4422 domain-containing protein [Pseudomonadota bacterium]